MEEYSGETVVETCPGLVASVSLRCEIDNPATIVSLINETTGNRIYSGYKQNYINVFEVDHNMSRTEPNIYRVEANGEISDVSLRVAVWVE